MSIYFRLFILQASVAINLSCNAAWSCVERLCQTSFDKSPQVCGELSEDAIIDLVSDVCGKSASLLDILYQCGSRKMNKLVTKSLEHWSFAAELFTRLSDVTPLVKQWVKVIVPKSFLFSTLFSRVAAA